MLHLSDGELALAFALSFVWAFIGYRLSEHDRRTLGRTPWGLPSMVWAFFWFLSLVLGILLYCFAHWNGVRRARYGPSAYGGPAGRPTAGRVATKRAPSVAEQFPAYPRPANVQTEPPVPDPEPMGPTGAVPQPRAQAQDESWPHSPPAWHPDPSGRFHFRWWDGYQWTSQVSIDGHHLIDTNPDQRIGPY